MEFIRKVVNGEDIKEIIDIPLNLTNKRLEILIFPLEENTIKTKKKKSLAGIFAKYANSNLTAKEENIWYEEAKE